jgi:hypothetical protein
MIDIRKWCGSGLYYLAAFVFFVAISLGQLFLGTLVAVMLGGFGYGLREPYRKRMAARKAYFEQQPPFESAVFRLSTKPNAFPHFLTVSQARDCAHKVARELSIEFLGLNVLIVDGEGDTQPPRKLTWDAKTSSHRRKRPDEPMDDQERRFQVACEQLKIRAAIDSKEGRLTVVPPDLPDIPADGTIISTGSAPVLHQKKFVNKTYYYKGTMGQQREWVDLRPTYIDYDFAWLEQQQSRR